MFCHIYGWTVKQIIHISTLLVTGQFLISKSEKNFNFIKEIKISSPK